MKALFPCTRLVTPAGFSFHLTGIIIVSLAFVSANVWQADNLCHKGCRAWTHPCGSLRSPVGHKHIRSSNRSRGRSNLPIPQVFQPLEPLCQAHQGFCSWFLFSQLACAPVCGQLQWVGWEIVYTLSRSLSILLHQVSHQQSRKRIRWEVLNYDKQKTITWPVSPICTYLTLLYTIEIYKYYKTRLLDVSFYDEQAYACYLNPSPISALKSVRCRVRTLLATCAGANVKTNWFGLPLRWGLV